MHAIAMYLGDTRHDAAVGSIVRLILASPTPLPCQERLQRVVVLVADELVRLEHAHGVREQALELPCVAASRDL